MSKKKLFAVAGLAAALSVLSPGCAKEEAQTTKDTGKQIQQAPGRRQGNRENIAISYIQRDKDYVKSINLLLSLHDSIIPEVQKTYGRDGVMKALKEAYSKCRMDGQLKDNSIAYSFLPMVLKNYGAEGHNDKDFEAWSKKFREAGQEAKKLLKEPESVHRKYVPASFNEAFLRGALTENKWKTCDEWEKEYRDSQARQAWGIR